MDDIHVGLDDQSGRTANDSDSNSNSRQYAQFYMVLYSMTGLKCTPFDGAAAEQPHAVHMASVRLRYGHTGV